MIVKHDSGVPVARSRAPPADIMSAIPCAPRRPLRHGCENMTSSVNRFLRTHRTHRKIMRKLILTLLAAATLPACATMKGSIEPMPVAVAMAPVPPDSVQFYGTEQEVPESAVAIAVFTPRRSSEVDDYGVASAWRTEAARRGANRVVVRRFNGHRQVVAFYVKPGTLPRSVAQAVRGDSTTISRTPSSTGGAVAPTGAGGNVRVRGYYRRDGTYVRPHTRSRPGSGSRPRGGSRSRGGRRN